MYKRQWMYCPSASGMKEISTLAIALSMSVPSITPTIAPAASMVVAMERAEAA